MFPNYSRVGSDDVSSGEATETWGAKVTESRTLKGQEIVAPHALPGTVFTSPERQSQFQISNFRQV